MPFLLVKCRRYNSLLNLTVGPGISNLQSTRVACPEYPIRSLDQKSVLSDYSISYTDYLYIYNKYL
jgi:hypothetical protein